MTPETLVTYPTQAAARKAQRAHLGADVVDRVLVYARELAASPEATVEAPADLYEAIEAVLGCWPCPSVTDDGTAESWFLGNRRMILAGGPAREHLRLQGKIVFRSHDGPC